MDHHFNMKSIPSLCFNKDVFAAEEFCIDKFVSDCRKYTGLETMKEDLGIYHKILCAAMIELINKDYADFVNLSSNLVGLDRSINSLTTPLSQLENEIKQMKLSLEDILNAAQNIFDKKASFHKQKILAQHALTVEETFKQLNDGSFSSGNYNDSSKLEALERIAFKFNVLQFHMSKIISTEANKIFSSKEEAITQIARNIEMEAESIFLKSLHNHSTSNLEKVLRIYSILNAESKAETSFRYEIVRPFLKEVVTSSNIAKPGLEYIFNQILNFIPNFCSDLLKITQKTKNSGCFFDGFDFLLNSLWPEIIDCFQSEYVFSNIGDLSQFNNNYSFTIKFLDQFERYLSNQKSVTKFRDLATYKDFISNYNLEVYFKIRFHEIASQFEESLLNDSMTVTNSDNNSHYKLIATSSLWTSVCSCWQNSIYMQPLKHLFWKLTLQLLSRYRGYIDSTITNMDAVTLAVLINDSDAVIIELKSLFVEVIIPRLENPDSNIEGAFNEAIADLEKLSSAASELIVKFLIEKCTSQLKMISSIPQRFRKTNRDLPTKSSPYVDQVFSPLIEFLDKSGNPRLHHFFQKEVTNGIFEQCLFIMKDVLTSIKKMEDSLKILKRARDNKSVYSGSNITDDDKIRRQLSLDVEHFEQLVLKSGIVVSEIKCLNELKDLVNAAERLSNI